MNNNYFCPKISQTSPKMYKPEDYDELLLRVQQIIPVLYVFTAITCDASNWPTPSNGYSSCSGLSKVKSGTICTVTCNRGYRISGSPSSRCDNDGGWYPNATSNCQGEKAYVLLDMNYE